MNKRILQLAIPNILSNLTIPLLSFVDTSIVGHLTLKEYIPAISVGGSVFMYVYGSLAILRMSTTGLSAQEYGKKNQNQLNKLLFQGVFIAIVIGVLLTLFRFQLFDLAIRLIKPDSAITPYASQYVTIRFLAAPATLVNFVLSGWFIGIQKSKTALLLSLVISGGNTLFSYVFVYVFGYQIEGVALGTVLGQYLGLLVSVFLVMRELKGLSLQISWNILNWVELRKYFLVSRDLFFRSLLLMSVFTFFRVQHTQDFIEIASANLLLIEIFLFMTFAVDGFALVAETMVGSYYGKEELKEMNKSIRYLFFWSFAVALLFSLTYVLFGNSVLSFMTDKKEVVLIACKYLPWLYVLPIVSVVPFFWDGVFIGITNTTVLILSVLIGVVIFFLTYYSTKSVYGNDALWLSLLLFFLARGIYQTVVAFQQFKLKV